MLEGNEVEVKYDGESGQLIVDVMPNGMVVIKNVYKKELMPGISTDNSNGMVLSVPALLVALADKTGNKVLKSLADVVEGVLKITPLIAPKA